MKKITIAIVLMISMIGWSQLSTVGSINDIVQSENTIKRVNKKEFADKLDALKDVQLIDVRTAGEYSRGTIREAVNIDYNSKEFEDLISKLDKTKPTLIFCQSGGRSARALQKFKAIGFEYVLELEGGYGGWK